jgi:hypothetical protein
MLKRIACVLFTGLVVAVPPAAASPLDENKMSEGTKGKTVALAPIKATPKKPIPSDQTKRCPQWHHLFRRYGLPVEVFSYIAWRESRCNPRAHNKTLNRNGSQDLGLVQVNNSWKTVTSQVCGTPYGKMEVLFDVHCNLSVARYLLANGGLGHWNF